MANPKQSQSGGGDRHFWSHLRLFSPHKKKSLDSMGSSGVQGGPGAGLVAAAAAAAPPSGSGPASTSSSSSALPPVNSSTQGQTASGQSAQGQQRGRRRSPVSGRRSEGTPSSSCSGRGSHHGSQEETLGPGPDPDADPGAEQHLSNGSSAEQLGQPLVAVDEVDGCHGPGAGAAAGAGTPQLGRTVANMRHVQGKISRTMDLIKEEQRRRDDNVNEYLKLASNVERMQVPQVKAVFEKKNQKSAQAIAQLQKKLERYHRQMADLEQQAHHHSMSVPSVSAFSAGGGGGGGGGSGSTTMSSGGDASSTPHPTSSHPHHHHHHHHHKGVLRDVGHGLKSVRDGISGLSGTVMSKPREFAHLIKNKFGSADNINTLAKSSENMGGAGGGGGGGGGVGGGGDRGEVGDGGGSHHGSTNLQQSGPIGGGGGGGGGGRVVSEEGSECSSSVTNESGAVGQQSGQLPAPSGQSQSQPLPQRGNEAEWVWRELQERKDESERLREDTEHLKQEMTFLTQALQEERFRCERLEEQMNDLTELHQNEMEHLKQGMADAEEKLHYQNEERLRDIQELLEGCQTKVSRMEHQQQQQQQYVTLEGLENSQARALAVKLINVLLTMLQVVLLLVATGAGILMPFLKTRARILTTVLFVGVAVFIFKQWPELQDLGSHLIQHYKQALSGN